DLVEPLGREGLGGSRSRLEHVEGRVHVHNEDRLAGISRLGESKQISVVEAGVPTGKREVGTRIMVRHGSFSPFGSRLGRAQRSRLSFGPDPIGRYITPRTIPGRHHRPGFAAARLMGPGYVSGGPNS